MSYPRPVDECNQQAGMGIPATKTRSTESLNLVERLRARRRDIEHELYKVNNTIELLEKNSALVEVVEVVLLAERKADPNRLY